MASPEPDHARKRTVFATLMLLAIPAAGVAGGSACTVTATFLPDLFLLAIALGLVPTALIVYFAYDAWGRSRARPGWAFFGLLLVTPISLTVGGFVALQGIMPAQPSNVAAGTYFLIAGCTAFTVWGTGYWLGLSGRLMRFWSWLKK